MVNTFPPLRWGLLATGGIARKFAQALQETELGVLVAVGSRSLESADAFVAEFGAVRGHGSYQALLDDPEVEAVYISPPHPLHAEWAIAAARAGKHVLCEKPLTMNLAEAEAVAAAAREADVFLMEAFMYRCHPFMARLRDLIASGAIGDVGLIESVFGFSVPFDPAHRLFNRELGGGGILDLGCYPVSASRFLAGATMGRPFADPVEVAGAAQFSDVTGMDVVASASLKFANGTLASLGCSTRLAQDSRLRIFGSLGSLEIVSRPWHAPQPGMPVAIRVTASDGATRTEEITDARSIYAIEADEFALAVRRGAKESSHMSVADTLGNMRTLDRWLAAVTK
ncbi:MAG TPA: Gfo/Idh/MocA family oxidoreductase [Chthoniobacterales bacterium]|jgi:predicted dehydrogenase